MPVYKRLLQFLKPHWKKLAIAMLCMVMVGFLTSAVAYIIKPVLDDIFIKKDVTKLTLLPVVVLIIYFGMGIFSYGQTYLMSLVGQLTVQTFRSMLYEHIHRLSVSYFDNTSTGLLMSRITNDVTIIQSSVSTTITGLLRDCFTIFFLVGVIFYRDWQLAIIAMLIFPIVVYPIVRFGKRLRKISRNFQTSMGSLSTILQETFTGARVVKAFCREDYECAKFDRENERLFKYMMKSVKIKAISSPLMEFMGGMGVAAVVWYGGFSVIRGDATPGNFFSFMAAVLMLYRPIKKISSINNEIQMGIAAAQRIFEVLDTPAEITDSKDADVMPVLQKSIVFDRVFFSYGDESVLKDISMEIKKGSVVALVGKSGSGKTTIANLLPRFYDVQKGSIKIDSRDIRGVTLKSLRGQIAFITQQSILFNGSVRDNIAYGDLKKGFDAIHAAAEAAYALEFIKDLPDGFDTIIGEQGVKLSGGQRQRICIARAILKNAPVLIMDEATSALDTDSERKVQMALENLMHGRTTLVIAHRLSTIINADNIIVISKGRIAEQGSHTALLEQGGEYKELYEMQFKNGED